MNLFRALNVAVYSLLTVRRSETIIYACVLYYSPQIYIVLQTLIFLFTRAEIHCTHRKEKKNQQSIE